MAKSKKDEYKYELIEIVDTLSESKKWAKVICKIVWGKNGTPSIDIRNIDMSTLDSDKVLFGHGISLSDDACERLAISLMKMGYIDMETIKKYQQGTLDDIFTSSDSKMHNVKVRRL